MTDSAKRISTDILTLSDLDDTLVTTRRKASLAGKTNPVLIVQNSLPERDTVSTPAMEKLFQLLSRNSVFIPITGRTFDSALKVLNEKEFTLLISHFGGHASLGGDIDPAAHEIYQAFVQRWNTHAHDTRATHQPDINTLFDQLTAIDSANQYGDRVKYNLAPDGLMNELVVKKDLSKLSGHIDDAFGDYRAKSVELIESLHGSLDRSPFLIHQNGNNLAFYLKEISKQECVHSLLKIFDLQNTLTISAGDSHSDLGFMMKADFLVAPTSSQLAGNL